MEDPNSQGQDASLDPRTGLPSSPDAGTPAPAPPPEPEAAPPTPPPPPHTPAIAPVEAKPAPTPVVLPDENEEAIQKELKKYNWGALFFTWIWGLCNGTPVALLAIVPFLNIFVSLILFIKGNEWAWNNKQWDSLESFRRTQRKWAAAAVILIFLFSLFLAGLFIVATIHYKSKIAASAAYETAAESSSSDQEENTVTTSNDPSLKTIKLKSGNIVRGRIVSESGTKLTIDIEGMGEIVFGRHEIESIESSQ